MSKNIKVRSGFVAKVPTQKKAETVGDNAIGTNQIQDLAVTRTKLANYGRPYITAVTGTYSVLITDNYIECSGAAFTATLPSPVGIAGQEFTFEKTDSSLTNIITITGTGFTTTLNTQGEILKVMSTGTAWKKVYRYIAPNKTSFLVTITATSVNPTKAAVRNEKNFYWREGRFLVIHLDYVQTGTGSGGTGFYKFAVPIAVTIDPAEYNTAGGSDLARATFGWAMASSASVESIGTVKLFDTTPTLCMLTSVGGSAGVVPTLIQDGWLGFGQTDVQYSFEARIPILGWND